MSRHTAQIRADIRAHFAPMLVVNGGPLEEISEQILPQDDVEEMIEELKPRMPIGLLWIGGETYIEQACMNPVTFVYKEYQVMFAALMNRDRETWRRLEFDDHVTDIYDTDIILQYVTSAENPELAGWNYERYEPRSIIKLHKEPLFGLVIEGMIRVRSPETAIALQA